MFYRHLISALKAVGLKGLHCRQQRSVIINTWWSWFENINSPVRIAVPLHHDDVVKWKPFPRYWPLCGEFTGDRWIPLTKASDRALMFSLDWINDWLNNREAGNLRRHRNSTSYRNTILSCFYLSVNSASANSAASFSIVFLAGTTKSMSWCRVFTVSTFQRSWWRHQMETFPRSWPFVWRIHRSPVNSPHKGLWRGALLFSLICAWIDGWTNNRDAGDLRRHRAHYDVTVMFYD